LNNTEKDNQNSRPDIFTKLNQLFKKIISNIRNKFKNKDENTKAVYKIFLTGEYEKKEKWLNEMSGKGLVLKSFFLFKYKFELGKENEYAYRIELLEHLPKSSENVEYFYALEKQGIDYVGSFLFWACFKKKCPPSSNEFSLRCDEALKVTYYKRVTMLSNIISGTMVLFAILLFAKSIMQYNDCKPYMAEGYDCKGFYVPYILQGVLFLFISILPQAMVFPIRDWGVLAWGKEENSDTNTKL